MIDPSARIEAGAAIGRERFDRPLLHHRPACDGRRRLPAARACQSHRPHHDRRAHRHPSLRLARLAAAVVQLSRRADPARGRRRLRYPRKRHHEHRHRGRRRRDRSRRPLFLHGRLACRARLQGRQPCRVRQQHGARRPRQRRRPCRVRRRRGGAPVRAHRRGRDDRGLERRSRRRHSVGHGAGPARQSGRAQCGRHAPARARQSRHPSLARGLSGAVLRRRRVPRAARARRRRLRRPMRRSAR